MGDECYWEARVRRKDTERFQEIVFGEIVDSERTVFEDDGMDYGARNECEEAAKEGLVFKVMHGAGSEYGEMEYCGIDGKFYGIERITCGRYCVALDKNGRVDERALQAARDYLEAVKRVEAILAEEEHG
jgi:hypothetical protein